MATVNVIEPVGNMTDLYLTHLSGQKFIAVIEPRTGFETNDRVKLYLDLEKNHIFEPDQTGRNVTLSERPA